LSFKPISAQKKIEAVSRVVAEEKVQAVARDGGVHRTSIYIWKERALLALEEALQPRNDGKEGRFRKAKLLQIFAQINIWRGKERKSCNKLGQVSTNLLPTYRVVAGYFKLCLHQLCTIHGRRAIARIIKDLPAEAKEDKFFSEYMVRIKKRFYLLFKEDDMGKINSEIGQIKRELKLFYTKEKRRWAEPMLNFIERNSKNLFLYKKFPGKKIDNTNNAAEIVFSLFKSQYKIMKQFQIRGGAQAHFDLFILRHNFRKFPRGKRKGSSPAQLEGLDPPIDDWSGKSPLAVRDETLKQSFRR